MKPVRNAALILLAVAWPMAARGQMIALEPSVIDSHPTVAEFREEISRSDIVARAKVVKILRRKEGRLADEDVIVRVLRTYKGSFESDSPCVRLDVHQSREWKPGKHLANVGEELILPIKLVRPLSGNKPPGGEQLHHIVVHYYTVSEDGKIASAFGFPPDMQEYATLDRFEKLILDEVNRPPARRVEYKMAEVLYFDDFDDGSLAGWILLEGERGFMREPYKQWNDVTWIGPNSVLYNQKPVEGEGPTAKLVRDPKTGTLHGRRSGTPIEIGVFNGRLRLRSPYYWQHVTAVTGDPEWTDYQLDVDMYNFNDTEMEGKGDRGQVNYLKFGLYGRVHVPNLPQTRGEHSFVAVEFGNFANYDVSEATWGGHAFQIRCKYPEPPQVWRDHSVLLRVTRILDYTAYPIPQETKIHLTARFCGNRVEGWIDGKKILEGRIPDDHPGAKKGRIGLWTFETWSEFDNVKVTRLVPANEGE